MAINLSDNINFEAPKHGDARFGPWTGVTHANDNVLPLQRVIGLTVGIITGSTLSEYWYYSGVTDNDLVLKQTASIGSGSGVNGSVFISDITPQSSSDNVGAKQFSSDGKVLDECITNTQLVTVSVLALPGNSNYKPVVTINDVQVTLTAQPDAPIFSGTTNVDLSGATRLTVIHEDGAQHSVVIVQDTPPQVLAANFTGNYPGLQSELKEFDTFNLYVESDVPVISVELDNYEAYKPIVTGVTSGTGHTITGIIADRGETAQDLRAKVRVQKYTGAWSSWFITSGIGDGVGYVVLNNRYPEIVFGTIDYPTTPIAQSALKDNESAIVNHTVSGYTTLTYSSPSSPSSSSNPTTQLSISGDTIYDPEKVVQRIDGGYNITTNNFRIVANREENDATTTRDTVVQIADEDQVITVSTPNNERLRSGGNDGTSTHPENYTYTITMTSTQKLLSVPTLEAPVGNWQDSGFVGNTAFTSFTRSLRILDTMPKGSRSWGALNTVNLAGKVVTTITTGSNYVLGGFVSREIPLTGWLNEAQMNVAVDIYTKVVLSWSFDPNVTVRAPLDTPAPLTNSWCLLTPINNSPVTIRILDSKTTASTQESTITIEELE